MTLSPRPGADSSPEARRRRARNDTGPPAGLELRETPEGVDFSVRVQPRASRDAITGEREGVLVVRLTAAPVEGAANRALVRFLGRTLGVAPSAVTIVSGAGGRRKRVAVSGVDAQTARTRLLGA
jgi:uncharacterized protein (TIGR00251 family)